MKIIKRSEASELYPKRYEIHVKRSPHSEWETKRYAQNEHEAISQANYAALFSMHEVRIIDNDL